MDPRWQSTTHVQTPPVPLSDVPEPLRIRLVEKVLDQVSAGHWTALDAADGLRALGFSASAEKVKAAVRASDRVFEDPAGYHLENYSWLVSRLARPVGTLTKGAA